MPANHKRTKGRKTVSQPACLAWRMKMIHPGLVTMILTIGVIAGLNARATKDNVGSELPELHLQFSGTTPDCAGRPLLIEFWATSCSSCRESVTHLNALHAK